MADEDVDERFVMNDNGEIGADGGSGLLRRPSKLETLIETVFGGGGGGGGGGSGSHGKRDKSSSGDKGGSGDKEKKKKK